VPDRELGAGAWSYFGDPRAISHDGDTFTGWISTSGNVWVARLSAAGKLRKKLIYRGLGRDDHNNPSLAFRPDGHIVVFFSPHSGRHLPVGQKSEMRYRISLKPFAIDDWGPVHLVGTNVPGGLGYTYPNALPQRGKLWLFWRGGGWNPTFSYTSDYKTWAPAREFVHFGHGQRPYAKYAGDGKTRIHGIFTNGHPTSFKNSLFYMRYENSGIFTAAGHKLGTLRSVPLQVTSLDPIYRYSDAGGRAWGHDIALENGHPRVVYTRRIANRDTFWFAYFNGTKWISRRIVDAGAGRNSFRSGGASFDHEDPRIIYLSRTIGPWNQIEAWVTLDHGRTWQTRQLTTATDGYAIRPVAPRGLTGRQRVLYVHGDERTHGYHDFTTRIRALDF
jgi:hypothetical protein